MAIESVQHEEQTQLEVESKEEQHRRNTQIDFEIDELARELEKINGMGAEVKGKIKVKQQIKKDLLNKIYSGQETVVAAMAADESADGDADDTPTDADLASYGENDGEDEFAKEQNTDQADDDEAES